MGNFCAQSASKLSNSGIQVYGLARSLGLVFEKCVVSEDPKNMIFKINL